MASETETVTIDARPEPITVEEGKTAVLVVDMQNDFGSEGGMFHRAGIDIGPIRAAVEPTARVLAAARAAGGSAVQAKEKSSRSARESGGFPATVMLIIARSPATGSSARSCRRERS